MKRADILKWGERWHYPFLAIGYEADPPTEDVLRHGREHYEALIGTRLRLASKRVARWNAIVARVEAERSVKTQVQEAIEVVDKLLETAKQESVTSEEVS